MVKSSCVKKDYDGGYFASAERNDMLCYIFDEELSWLVCGEKVVNGAILIPKICSYGYSLQMHYKLCY